MFTVLKTDDSSQIYGHNMTAEDAMDEIMTHDGYEYRIEEDPEAPGEWRLMASHHSRNSSVGLGDFNQVFFTLADSENEATEKFAKLVIEHSGDNWSRLEAIPTDEFFKREIDFLKEELELCDEDEQDALMEMLDTMTAEWESVKANRE